MTKSSDEGITIAFVGYARAGETERAVAYEDRVLELLGDHGARLLFRGRRRADQDPALPLEVHVIWFPRRAAMQSFLADERRRALLAEVGEVFTQKIVVEVDPLAFDPRGPRMGR